MIVGIVIGSVLLVLLIAFFVLLFWIYKAFFYTPKKGQNDEYNIDGFLKLLDENKFRAMIKELKEVPYEDFYITSYDGLKLHAYFYENKNSNEYVLLFNGYRGSPRRDYCARAIDLIRDGRNVILCDQRGHGLSEGHMISLGRREQHDVVSWVEFVQKKFGKTANITVAGTSLGATTVLLASDKLPSEVKVFADSAYSSQKGIIKQIVKRRKMNPTICWWLCYLSALIFGHVRLIDEASINVSKSKCRILMVHCTNDTIAPLEMNKELFALKNNKNIRVVLFENMQHALAYFKEREKYKEIFYGFLDE